MEPNSEFLKEIDELLLDSDTEENSDKLKSVNESSKESLPLSTSDSTMVYDGVAANCSSPSAFSSDSNRAAAIRAALNGDALEELRKLCEGERVPEEVRVDVWKVLLGLNRQPDTIGTWSGPLDCENQAAIHQHCLDQIKKVMEGEEVEAKALVMEEVITFYCKSRNLRYNEESGWVELLAPLMALGLSKSLLFNSLYTLLAKLIPRDCRIGGKPFDLFRLLLLYHDPELCSVLDTRKLLPHLYLQPWLRSLFACQCSLSVVLVLWEIYLLDRDPFLVFFLSLVMVINARDLIMDAPTTTPVQEIQTMMLDLPSQLTPEDIPDFVSLAQYYASRTPQSFRKDYYSVLFGSGRSLSSMTPGVLCLPVHMQEVLDSCNPEAQSLKYFIVDCRPLHHFSCGHLPSAMHLDTDLLLHSPKDFTVAMDRLCERVKQSGVEGGEHLCFLGSGREQEDQYLHMVVAKFLQRSMPYVSVARGGFLELCRLLGAQVDQVLEDFDSEKCHTLYQHTRTVPSMPSHGDASDSDSESYATSALYRQRLQAKGQQLYASLATSWRDRSQRLRIRLGDMWKKKNMAEHQDRPLGLSGRKPTSKPYRNLPDNVFVIADEDEDMTDKTGWSSEDDSAQELVNISLYSTAPHVMHSFPCEEMADGRLYPSHLVIMSEEFVVLRETSDRPGWARVRHTNLLLSIIKITAKKKHPDIITFKFGHEGEDGGVVLTSQLRLRIPSTQRATNAIKQQILKLSKTNNN